MTDINAGQEVAVEKRRGDVLCKRILFDGISESFIIGRFRGIILRKLFGDDFHIVLVFLPTGNEEPAVCTAKTASIAKLCVGSQICIIPAVALGSMIALLLIVKCQLLDRLWEERLTSTPGMDKKPKTKPMTKMKTIPKHFFTIKTTSPFRISANCYLSL